eukprot:GHVU01006151.1.p1 GENE.GHVU01006151.1~~GHVU01006151.1.p1  ORF type:complete len:108 (-),score=5.38 GHVU01006151.1:155-478(-)
MISDIGDLGLCFKVTEVKLHHFLGQSQLGRFPAIFSDSCNKLDTGIKLLDARFLLQTASNRHVFFTAAAALLQYTDPRLNISRSVYWLLCNIVMKDVPLERVSLSTF